VSQFAPKNVMLSTSDEFLIFCQNNPTYDEAVAHFGQKVFEYELLGKIEVRHGQLFLL
jgi:DNA processing protein